MKTVLELHREITRGLHDPFFSKDPVYLALALFGEAGELANFIKKGWRDAGTSARDERCPVETQYDEEIRDEIADLRVYIELLADTFAIGGPMLDELYRGEFQFIRKTTTTPISLALLLGRSIGRLSGNVVYHFGTQDLAKDIRADIVTIRAQIEGFAWHYSINGERLTARVEDKLIRYAAKHRVSVKSGVWGFKTTVFGLPDDGPIDPDDLPGHRG